MARCQRCSGVPSRPLPRHLPARPRTSPAHLRACARLQVCAARPASTAPLEANEPATWRGTGDAAGCHRGRSRGTFRRARVHLLRTCVRARASKFVPRDQPRQHPLRRNNWRTCPAPLFSSLLFSPLQSRPRPLQPRRRGTNLEARRPLRYPQPSTMARRKVPRRRGCNGRPPRPRPLRPRRPGTNLEARRPLEYPQPSTMARRKVPRRRGRNGRPRSFRARVEPNCL